MDVDDVLQYTYEDPRVPFAYLKHTWDTGRRQQAFDGLKHYIQVTHTLILSYHFSFLPSFLPSNTHIPFPGNGGHKPSPILPQPQLIRHSISLPLPFSSLHLPLLLLSPRRLHITPRSL